MVIMQHYTGTVIDALSFVRISLSDFILIGFFIFFAALHCEELRTCKYKLQYFFLIHVSHIFSVLHRVYLLILLTKSFLALSSVLS